MFDTTKIARAHVEGIRQETQYTCMATSLAACIKAHGKPVTEADVNKVMGAGPMRGARWEEALGTLQYFGMRGVLVVPGTLAMLREATSKGNPVMIAWNPEARPWSHASVVVEVDDDDMIHVMDPNIPDPDETFRVIHKSEFYKTWGEPVGDTMVIRRPMLIVEREVTPEGKQVRASTRKANSDLQYAFLDAIKEHPALEKELSAAADAVTNDLEASSVEGGLEMMAYDLGYESGRMPSWLKKLGRAFRINVNKLYKGGQEDAESNRYASEEEDEIMAGKKERQSRKDRARARRMMQNVNPDQAVLEQSQRARGVRRDLAKERGIVTGPGGGGYHKNKKQYNRRDKHRKDWRGASDLIMARSVARSYVGDE